MSFNHNHGEHRTTIISILFVISDLSIWQAGQSVVDIEGLKDTSPPAHSVRYVWNDRERLRALVE